MTENRVSLLSTRKQPTESLLDRARNGRRTALADRMVTIIQTSTDGTTFAEHRFPAMPRVVDLLARLGGDALVVAVRTERLDSSPVERPDIAAE
ncbi:MAG: hypothetical protein O9292_13460 [Rhodobacteraceae bacterium]|nr:hypothetical protein [Paracoccaceae bacterium]